MLLKANDTLPTSADSARGKIDKNFKSFLKALNHWRIIVQTDNLIMLIILKFKIGKIFLSKYEKEAGR